MMKILIISVLIVISFTSLQAQNVDHLDPQDENAYRPCVKAFYKLLLSERNVSVDSFSTIYASASADDEADLRGKMRKLNIGDIDYNKLEREIEKHSDTITSLILNKMRKYKEQLTQGLGYKSLSNLIDSSLLYNEGWEFSMTLELNFPNKRSVFFEMNRDAPKQIEYIWLPSGESLGDLVFGNSPVEKLERPGIINDPDGYTNIRERPDIHSAVTGKFVKDEIFYFTPVGGSNWWPVYRDFDGKQLGYIFYDRILTYADFPTELKEKVNKERGEE